MRLSKHFTLAELTASQTAIRLGIDNTEISETIYDNLQLLCERVLEPVREEFGVTIITSGYRCPELNQAIGGAPESQHIDGCAADFRIPNVNPHIVAQWMVENLQAYDQIIQEHGRWVHASYVAIKQQRFDQFTALKHHGKTVFVQGIHSPIQAAKIYGCCQ